MSKRSRFNLLAAVLVAAGAFALAGPTPATAAVFDGCADMENAHRRKGGAVLGHGRRRAPLLRDLQFGRVLPGNALLRLSDAALAPTRLSG